MTNTKIRNFIKMTLTEFEVNLDLLEPYINNLNINDTIIQKYNRCKYHYNIFFNIYKLNNDNFDKILYYILVGTIILL